MACGSESKTSYIDMLYFFPTNFVQTYMNDLTRLSFIGASVPRPPLRAEAREM